MVINDDDDHDTFFPTNDLSSIITGNLTIMITNDFLQIVI